MGRLILDYILYCDESIKEGKFYSNFYGGALISGEVFDKVNADLNEKKQKLGFNGEIKWSKVTENYLNKYIEMISIFFDYIKSNVIKIRIMFTQNCRIAKSLTPDHKENEFYLLYYQFFKHIYGFQYCNPHNIQVYLKPYFDVLPDKKEKNDNFKDFIYKLQMDPIFQSSNIKIRREDIAEVVSHNHIILQCMDIILGAMQFRLNNLHLEKPEGSCKRGKRTIAKEKLYKHINSLIREIYPGFNIGETTGVKGNLSNRWSHSYRHWLFVSSESAYDKTKTKKNEIK